MTIHVNAPGGITLPLMSFADSSGLLCTFGIYGHLSDAHSQACSISFVLLA